MKDMLLDVKVRLFFPFAFNFFYSFLIDGRHLQIIQVRKKRVNSIIVDDKAREKIQSRYDGWT